MAKRNTTRRFYCDRCGEHYGWPVTEEKSRGTCEICMAISVCNVAEAGELTTPGPLPGWAPGAYRGRRGRVP